MSCSTISKFGISSSELALSEMLDNCIDEGALDIAIKTLVEVGDEFPLRMEYLLWIGRKINDVSAMEETREFEISNI
jgi:hypothetical protein